MSRAATIHERQLARDVLVMAKLGGMPETFWSTDGRINRACKVLGWSPEQARRWAERTPRSTGRVALGERVRVRVRRRWYTGTVSVISISDSVSTTSDVTVTFEKAGAWCDVTLPIDSADIDTVVIADEIALANQRNVFDDQGRRVFADDGTFLAARKRKRP